MSTRSRSRRVRPSESCHACPPARLTKPNTTTTLWLPQALPCAHPPVVNSVQKSESCRNLMRLSSCGAHVNLWSTTAPPAMGAGMSPFDGTSFRSLSNHDCGTAAEAAPAAPAPDDASPNRPSRLASFAEASLSDWEGEERRPDLLPLGRRLRVSRCLSCWAAGAREVIWRRNLAVPCAAGGGAPSMSGR